MGRPHVQALERIVRMNKLLTNVESKLLIDLAAYKIISLRRVLGEMERGMDKLIALFVQLIE